MKLVKKRDLNIIGGSIFTETETELVLRIVLEQIELILSR